MQLLKSLGYDASYWDKDIETSGLNQEPNYEIYLEEVPDAVSIDTVELDDASIDNIEQKVLSVLDKIIKNNLSDFDRDEGYKVRPGYGYDKFYLDFVDGSFDMSLQSLVHYIMHEDGHYQKFLNRSQYARLLYTLQQYPESIFNLDHDLDENYDHIQHDMLDRIYYQSVRFVGTALIKNGFDVRDTFEEYLDGWDVNIDGDKDV